MTRVKLRQGLSLAAAVIAVLLAMVGPLIVPYDPQSPTREVLQSPSLKHVFGTDSSGLDVFSVAIAAYRTDLVIALLGVMLALFIGVLLGILSGFSFNRNRAATLAGAVIDRLMDLVQSVPVTVFGLALAVALGRGVKSVIIAVTFVTIPIFARLLRTSLKGIEHSDMVAACRSVGVRETRILWRHMLPNAIDSTLANASIVVGQAILLTASLSFLGAGVRPPTPEWGAEISVGANYVATGQWWISVFPGILLALTVIIFASLGDEVRRRITGARPSGADVSIGDKEQVGVVDSLPVHDIYVEDA